MRSPSRSSWASFRPPTGEIPNEPGVYRFRDGDGRVIYVGKANSLRSRLTSYFQDPSALHQRTRTMVSTARSVDWVVVGTEVEALSLEYSWIKEFDPRFNVRYRDDKSYPFLAVTVGEEFPRSLVMRGEKRPGVRYFGPYAHAWAIRETVDQLLRVFPMRTCSRGVFQRAHTSGRPCLLGYIDKCSAPCVGSISAQDHRAIVDDFCAFLAGDTAGYLKDREDQMAQAAAALDYEKAARLRDDLFAMRRALERNTVVLPDSTDADIVGLVSDELEASLRVFHVRAGRIRGERGFIVERVDDADEGRLVGSLLEQMYGEADADIPRLVLVSALPAEADLTVLTEWLGQRRGGGVRIQVPKRGDKHALMQTVERNASQSLATHKLRRSGDLTARSQALNEIGEALDLATAPLRIECFDVSNLGADDVVASMVVFEDGLPRPSEYRKFAIKGFEGQNDVAAIAEVIRRRFRRLGQAQERTDEGDGASLELFDAGHVGAGHGDVGQGGAGHVGAGHVGAGSNPGSGLVSGDGLIERGPDAGSVDRAGAGSSTGMGVRAAAAGLGERVSAGMAGRGDDQEATGARDSSGLDSSALGSVAGDRVAQRFAYRPSLVVIDGGPPQVDAAAQELADLGVVDVAVCGLAKRLEEVWLPGDEDPVILPRASQGLYLLQRVRDEAHRTALRYQRQKRSARMTTSALDEIPGLGPARRKTLLTHFGSVKQIRRATPDEIAALPGFGPALAERVLAALLAPASAPTVNLTTGEVIGDDGAVTAPRPSAPTDQARP